MIRMVLTSALMLLLFASTAFSQLVYDFTGTGARAAGMGNAFIAVSDDASAASWNPAGLTAHEKLMMGFDFDSYSPDNKFENDGIVFQENPNFSAVSQFSIAVPFRFRGSPMVFGVNYGRVFQEFWNDGANATIPWENLTTTGLKDSSVLTTNSASEQHSNLKAINFALGTKLSQNLSGGVAINVYSGQSIGTSLLTNEIPHFTADVYSPQYVSRVQTIEVIDTAKYSGTNFTIGTKYHGESFDLGVMLRTGFDLRRESDAKINSRTVDNGLLQRVGSDTLYIDNQLVKIGIPKIIGVGAALRPSLGLTVAADFEYRAFSGTQIKVRDSIYIRPGSTNEEFFTVYDLDQNNSTALRVGLEYLWNSPWESFPIIPLRVGFGSVSLPTNQLNADVDPNDGIPPVTVEESSVTSIHFGLGVRWSQIYLDAAYVRTTIDMGITQSTAGWDNSSSSFTLGFTGYF